MKTTLHNFTTVMVLASLVLAGKSSCASQAYGTVNNFDVVNDNGVPCHGFEIELDDIHTKDITYTYDYNHYGTPKIREFTSLDSLGTHTNVMVDYQASWTNTGWSAYTAVPAGPIAPTQGHQFTNPNTNFGGEHFGVGYRAQPTKVTYFWLVDNGGHMLTRGGQVNVTTPVFTYTPAAPGVAAQAQAVIPAPVPPVPPAFEFSGASWVKVITTTSHTNTEVKIGDLMTPDPEDPNGKDWRNGQTNIQVEAEWQLLQIDYGSTGNPPPPNGGPNGQLAGANHQLTNSDDVVTYRYEYYAYVGPYDDLDIDGFPGTHQALAETVAPDGIHGVGLVTNTFLQVIDRSAIPVVGKFLGAQMSAMGVTPPIGLIDHLPDGEVNATYPTRSVVIAGDTNFTATLSGTLPTGMAFDAANGWVYGTPSTAGIFIVTVTASTSNSPALTKTYPFMVGTGAILPPHSSVDVSLSDTNAGTASGNGVFTNGTTTSVTAVPTPGYAFTGWTEDGAVVSSSPGYTFTNIINRSLKATFRHQPKLAEDHALPGQRYLRWPTNDDGFVMEEITSLGSTNWAASANVVSVSGTNYQMNYPLTSGAKFYRLRHP